MNTLLQRLCPCCGSSEYATEVRSKIPAEDLEPQQYQGYWSGLSFGKAFFSYARCKKCQMLFAPMYINQEQLKDLYSHLSPNMEEETGADSITVTQRGYFIEAMAQGVPLHGGYLEIGPDVGHVTRIAAAEGHYDKFWLFEPNTDVHEELATATQGRPTQISSEMMDLSIVPDESIGLAVLIHVLDHLLDPSDMLRQVASKLRPGGGILLVTHNEHSLLRKILGNKWPPFCMQHPELYNPDSMRRILTTNGYGRIEVRRSRNFFPVKFLAQQAASVLGVNLSRFPLPNVAFGLKLGNIITVAFK